MRQLGKKLQSIAQLCAICSMPFWAYGQGAMVIESGASMVISGGAFVVLEDMAFTNNGNFNAGTSTVVVMGSASDANTALGGTSTTNFYHLTINKSANGTQLANNINVDHTLTLSSGTLDLNGYDITLDPTNGNLAGETENNRVWGTNGGTINITVDLNAPSGANPGNLGAEITSSANLGSTLIARGHVPPNATAAESIRRYYTITPTNDSGLDATLVFNYLDAEIGGLTEVELDLYRRPSDGNWYAQDATLDFTNNTLTKNNIDAFSDWTAGGVGVLPVDLVFFQAKCQGAQANLTWQTASEQNSSHFIVERSENGQEWTAVGEVGAQGNSDITHNYEWTSPELGGDAYYRLTQIDINKKYEVFHTVHAACSQDIQWAVNAFPNPTEGKLKLEVSSITTEQVEYWMYDAVGRLFEHSHFNPNQLHTTDMSRLPHGTYMLHFKQGDKNGQVKVIKN